MLKELDSGRLPVILNSPSPFALDFGADNCSDCERLNNVIERVSDNLKNKIDVYYVNKDKVPEITDRYQVQDLPTLILFKGGEPIDKLSGIYSEEEIHAFLIQ